MTNPMVTMQRHATIAAAVACALLLVAACKRSDSEGAEPLPVTIVESSATTSAPPEDGLSLVAIGDSIPDQTEQECPGCTGFVERYAAAVEEATGESVEVDNQADHTNKTLDGLLQELDSTALQEDLAAADVIVVGIAHNSNQLNLDEPCGAPLVDDRPDWSAMTEECATTSAAAARPHYDELFSRIVALREGKPTVFRTIGRYNDWIGWPDGHLTPEQDRQTATFVTTWSRMICESAGANGFGCADLSPAFNGSDGLDPSGDLLGADYTHLSDRGHELVAELLVTLGFDPLA